MDFENGCILNKNNCWALQTYWTNKADNESFYCAIVPASNSYYFNSIRVFYADINLKLTIEIRLYECMKRVFEISYKNIFSNSKSLYSKYNANIRCGIKIEIKCKSTDNLHQIGFLCTYGWTGNKFLHMLPTNLCF